MKFLRRRNDYLLRLSFFFQFRINCRTIYWKISIFLFFFFFFIIDHFPLEINIFFIHLLTTLYLSFHTISLLNYWMFNLLNEIDLRRVFFFFRFRVTSIKLSIRIWDDSSFRIRLFLTEAFGWQNILTRKLTSIIIEIFERADESLREDLFVEYTRESFFFFYSSFCFSFFFFFFFFSSLE